MALSHLDSDESISPYVALRALLRLPSVPCRCSQYRVVVRRWDLVLAYRAVSKLAGIFTTGAPDVTASNRCVLGMLYCCLPIGKNVGFPVGEPAVIKGLCWQRSGDSASTSVSTSSVCTTGANRSISYQQVSSSLLKLPRRESDFCATPVDLSGQTAQHTRHIIVLCNISPDTLQHKSPV